MISFIFVIPVDNTKSEFHREITLEKLNENTVDKDGNKIEAYWKAERNVGRFTVTHYNKTLEIRELNELWKKENYKNLFFNLDSEYPECITISGDAPNKNILDNIYFAVSEFMQETFNCPPIIF